MKNILQQNNKKKNNLHFKNKRIKIFRRFFKMKVGCVKEIKNNEFRVGMTPDNVKSYVNAGHDVYIEKGAGEGVIAPKVWASCMAKESVLSADRVSKVDYWVSYIAQYYDINFPETYEIMREHDYVKRIADRVPYALPETQEKMDILVAEMEKYMDERIRNGK